MRVGHWLLVASFGCGPGPVSGSGSGATAGDGATPSASEHTGSTGHVTESESGSGTVSSSSSGTETTGGCGPGDPFMPVTEPCADGAALDQWDDAGPTGLAECSDGSVHSYGIACCSGEASGPCAGGEGNCAEDSDCTTSRNGVCRAAGFQDFCICLYGYCNTDADCEEGEACVCSAPELWSFMPYCQSMSCRTDADCDEQQCGLSRDDCGNPNGLYCHTPEDDCHGPADCAGESDLCVYRESAGKWICFPRLPCD